MKHEPKRKPPLAVVEDPYLRFDIMAKRLLERIMTKHCTDPALVFVYARFKPGIEAALEDLIGPIKLKPVKVRRRRAK